jgi:hypothetical protein
MNMNIKRPFNCSVVSKENSVSVFRQNVTLENNNDTLNYQISELNFTFGTIHTIEINIRQYYLNGSFANETSRSKQELTSKFESI